MFEIPLGIFLFLDFHVHRLRPIGVPWETRSTVELGVTTSQTHNDDVGSSCIVQLEATMADCEDVGAACSVNSTTPQSPVIQFPVVMIIVATLSGKRFANPQSIARAKRHWSTVISCGLIRDSLPFSALSQSIPRTSGARTCTFAPRSNLLYDFYKSRYQRGEQLRSRCTFHSSHHWQEGQLRSSMKFSRSAVSTLFLSNTAFALNLMAPMCTQVSPSSPLASITLDNSWPRDLSPETPENLQKSRDSERLPPTDDNRTRRPVFNGHYVLVQPTGLRDPERVLVSQDVAKNLLQLTNEQIESDDFVQWLSGNLVLQETWATPYALSIMGTRYTSNCPYGTGNGYGDGRAISIAEFNGYELQLKGAGRTPFHRGADGRAVLRSSIREFLASEAMHYLGVETTRALSLIRSRKDTVQRPWYSDDAVLKIPDMDDLRLAQYPPEQRKQIIQQLRNTQKADPNILISEPCAITCRVAPSFTRIGHLDLFARRAEKASLETSKQTGQRFNTSTREWKELEQIIWHACKREYKKEAYDPFIDDNNLAGAASKLFELSATKIATMVANWVRVGFAQGNFNADNCLISGKTMDYGPFGWMEEFTPLFAKWTGSGQHFGFLNQPSAGFVNYQILVESVAPVIAVARGDDTTDKVADEAVQQAQKVFNDALDKAIRSKMGLPADADAADDLWDSLKRLLQESRADWTIFWRQLTYVMRDFPELDSEDYDEMMETLEGDATRSSGAFYEALAPELRRQWIAWIKDWRDLLRESGGDGQGIFELMRTSNPKYVLREWMLVDAYSSAADDDYSILNELYELIQKPYDEGTEKQVTEYYRQAPASAAARGGTAFMS